MKRHMSGKFGFYAILSAIVVLTLWVGSYVFSPFEKESSEQVVQKHSENADAKESERELRQKSPEAKESQRKRPSSVWQDERFFEGDWEARFGRSLKENAQIERKLDQLSELYQARRDEEFLSRLEPLIEENPDVPEYVALLGDYHYNEGNWEEAEEAISDLLELDPENSFARTTLAEVHLYQRENDKALDALNSVLEQDPGYPDALNGLVALYEVQGNLEKGYARIEEIYQENPNNGNTAAVYAETLAAQMRFEERREVLEQAVRDEPDNLLIRNALAEEAITEEDFEAAREHVRVLRENAGENEDTLRTAKEFEFSIAFGEGDYDRAVEIATKVAEENPNDMDAQMRLEFVKEELE